jgi:hypothetical protein
MEEYGEGTSRKFQSLMFRKQYSYIATIYLNDQKRSPRPTFIYCLFSLFHLRDGHVL